MKKQKLTLIVLLIIALFATIIANTYARYNKRVASDATAVVAKWSFNADGFGASRTDHVSSSQIIQGKLAPGTSGTINVDIDVTDCEVAVDYLIILHSFEGRPTHLVIKDEAGEELEYDSVNNRYTIEGSILVTEQDDLKDANDNVIKHVRLPFEWPYETVPTAGVSQSALDEIDTNEGQTIEEMSFYITVTGMQQAQSNKVTCRATITGNEIEPVVETKTVKLEDKTSGVIDVEVDATGSTTAVDYTITLSNIQNGLTNITFTSPGHTITKSGDNYILTGTISLAEIQAGNTKKTVIINYTGTNAQQGKLDTYNGARIDLVSDGATTARTVRSIRIIADANAPMTVNVTILAREAQVTVDNFTAQATVTDNANGIVSLNGTSTFGIKSITYTGPRQGTITPTINGSNYTATANVGNGTYTFTITDNKDNTRTAEATIDGVTSYTISSAEDLCKFRDYVNQGDNFAGVTVTQTADIDLSSVCSSTKGSWIPIGATKKYFAGTYDGNYHSIDYLYCKTNIYEGIALFSKIESTATIRNVIMNSVELENTTINAEVSGAAGIVIENYGKIENCGIESGNIKIIQTNGHARAAGICVYSKENTTINQCYNKVNIYVSASSQAHASGISSWADNNCHIIDCYNTGKMIVANGSEKYAAGIIADKFNRNGVVIEKCYNIGILSTSNSTGGILGRNSGGSLILSNCYCLTNATNGAIEVNSDTLKTYATDEYLGSAYVSDTYNLNDGYPILRWELKA